MTTFNVAIDRGATGVVLALTAHGDLGAIRDVTGWSFTCAVTTLAGGYGDPVYTITGTIISAENGLVGFKVSAEDATATAPGTYYHTITAIDPDLVETEVANGTWEVIDAAWSFVGGKSVQAAQITDVEVAAANKDGSAGTYSLRSLGTGAQQAAAGNHSHATFTDVAAGFAPASGGGTSNYLRADGTWATPAGGSGISDGDYGDAAVSGSGTVITVESIGGVVPGSAAFADTSDFAPASHNHDASYQPLDADLTALAGVSSTGILERTGAGTAGVRATGTASATDLLTRADGDGRYATAGHDHGGVYQPLDSDLTAIAALATTGLVERTGSGTAAIRSIGTDAGANIPDRDAADARYQPLDATLTALAALDSTAGILRQTGADTFTRVSASDVLDFITSTRGSLLYRGASGWAGLAPGTSGYLLVSNGSGADPSWASAIPESSVTNLVSDLAAKVASTRSISTSGQLSGGGDLSADRTITWTDPWAWKVLASDFSTSSASAQNVDNGGGDSLAFAPAASKVYVVEAMLMVQAGSSGTTAPKPGYSWPTGVSYGGAALRQPVTAGGEIFNHAIYSTAGALTATSLPNGTAGWLCTLIATFVAGASPSGNFQVTFQSETGGTTVTMKAGSWIRYRPIA